MMPELCVICEETHDDIAIRDTSISQGPRAICGPCYFEFKDKKEHYPNVKEILSKSKKKEDRND